MNSVDNSLGALNNILFEQLERLQDDSLSDEDLEKELRRADSVTSVAQTIIHNGELAMKAIKYADEMGYGKQVPRDQKKLPPMLES